MQEREVKCTVSLYNVLSSEEKEAVANSISDTLLREGVQDTKIHRYRSGTVAISATVKPSVIRELGRDYNTVRLISPNNALVISRTLSSSDLPNLLEREPAVTDVPVAVVDSGIKSDAPALAGLIVETHPHLPSGSSTLDLAHGTLVGSRVIYGDDIESVMDTHRLQPMCKVVDVPVFGVSNYGELLYPDEADLADILDEIVDELAPRVRIYNLSLGADNPIPGNTFSLLAQQMDYLSRRYDVLFVVAAGNIQKSLAPHPTHFLREDARIQAPAESLLALTVGSVAKRTNMVTLSERGEVSPFSCRGPGADDGIKPELVAHGGNVSFSWRPLFGVSAYGIDATGQKLAYDVGTSFAAPLVSQWAARILDRYPNASTNLVRALLCHFGRPVNTPAVTGFDPGLVGGFGEPGIGACLVSPYGSATYLYEGSITVDDYQYIQFHVPASLAPGGSTPNLKVRATLVYNPPVDQGNDAEYSQARMMLTLSKRTNEGWRKVQPPSEYPSYRVPWNPVIHLEKTFTRAYATGLWEARTRLITRDRVGDGYAQDYALVIEVIDPQGTHDIHSEINSQYGGIYASPIGRAA